MEATARFLGTPSLKRVLALVNWWHPLLLISLAILIILPKLGEGSLRDWDEAIYAQVSREIVQSGNWITLHYGYQPFFEKPPLLMWITAIFYKLFGINEFWARVPSAISGIVLVWITYLTGKEIYESRTGFLAGLILLGTYGFVFEARNGETDMLLSLFVLTGIFAYVRLRNDSPKWWYLILASCALAFMSKFWAGLVLPLVLAIILLLEHKISETLHCKHFWWGVLLAAIIVIPWHLLVYLQNGQAFIDIYVARDLLKRTSTSMEGHSGSPLFYLDALRRSFSPWYFLFPFALALAVKEIIPPKRKSNVITIAIVFIFGLYTFVVNTKNPSYILPIYPALSILSAHLITLAFATPKSRVFIWVITAALLATTIAQDKLLILCILIGIGFVILIKTNLLAKNNVPQIITSFVFVAFLLMSLIGYILGNHRLSLRPIYGRPATPIAQIATLAGKQRGSTIDPLIGFAMEEDWDSYFAVEGPTALFYSNRPIEIAYSWDRLEELMVDQDTAEILIAEKYLDHLSDDFDVSVIERVDPLVYARISR